MDQVTSEINVDVVQKDQIFAYVDCFESSNQKYKCLVAGCTASLSNKSAAIKHLKGVHKDVYEAVNTMKSKQTSKTCDIKIVESPAKIWHAILQLVIFCALPFSIVQEWGFQLLIKPYVTAFKSTNSNFSVGRTSIRTKISEQANQIKQIIIKEVKGKMICLLLDIASRYNRSVLGISIVFYDNGQLNTRTIGMITLNISQTAKNLFEIVKSKLDEFEISLDQVFSVTTDNGKNLIKMVQIFRTYQADNSNAPSCSNESSDEEDNDDAPIEMNFNWNEAHSDEIFDPENFNDDYFYDLLTNLRCEFPNSCYTGLLTGISCAAHCLNLVVTDAIKASSELSNLIDKCRTLAKKLRTPNMRNELRKKAQKMAMLDVPTRWSSLFDMVCVHKYLFSSIYLN